MLTYADVCNRGASSAVAWRQGVNQEEAAIAAAPPQVLYVYICMYVCMYIYAYATSVYGVPGGSCHCCRAPTGARVYIYIYICIYIGIDIGMDICLYMHTHTHTHTHLQTYMHTCNICVHVYMYMYIYMYVCIYICIYIYILYMGAQVSGADGAAAAAASWEAPQATAAFGEGRPSAAVNTQVTYADVC
jgi:hypothetical protein